MEASNSKDKDINDETKRNVKPKTDNRMDVRTAGVPVDYSFRKAESLAELDGGLPREYRVGLPKTGRSKKYLSRTLWVNHNNLMNLTNISSLVNSCLDQPECISWLDVSFNEIQIISSEITSFHNLMILYLHGNKINFLMEVAKLKSLKKLRSLTLHGNPIEQISDYRLRIIKLLPQLRNLDFSTIAEYEREDTVFRAI